MRIDRMTDRAIITDSMSMAGFLRYRLDELDNKTFYALCDVWDNGEVDDNIQAMEAILKARGKRLRDMLW